MWILYWDFSHIPNLLLQQLRQDEDLDSIFPPHSLHIFVWLYHSCKSKKFWYNDLGLLRKQADGPVTTLTIIINHSILEGKKIYGEDNPLAI